MEMDILFLCETSAFFQVGARAKGCVDVAGENEGAGLALYLCLRLCRSLWRWLLRVIFTVYAGGRGLVLGVYSLNFVSQLGYHLSGKRIASGGSVEEEDSDGAYVRSGYVVGFDERPGGCWCRGGVEAVVVVLELAEVKMMGW